MATSAVSIDLSKTVDCVFIETHFSMGIGRMRQIRDLKVETTADPSQLRHQKQLIDSPELDAIRSQDGHMSRHLESVSCEYAKSIRFLPNSEVAPLFKVMKAYQAIRRPALVAKFMEAYRKLEAVDFEPLSRPAPDGLGDQFDRGDYPKSEVVERGFSFTYNLRPVGEVNLKGLPDYIIAEEIEKDRQQREVAVIEWRDTMRFLGQKAVDTLFEALKPQEDGKKRKLFDSTVDNLQEFLKTFTTRDLAGDIEYQKTVIDPLKLIMKGVSMDNIRHSDNLRAYIVNKVEGIRKDANLLVQATGRKFR